MAQFTLEYCGYSAMGKVVGGVGNTLYGIMAGFAREGSDGLLKGLVWGLAPWIYSEIWLGSIIEIVFNETYLQRNLKEVVEHRYGKWYMIIGTYTTV